MPTPSDLSTKSKGGFNKLRAFHATLERLEQGCVSILLVITILFATYQIGLRWFTSGGLPWIDPLLRYLVLWGGLLGAVLATARAQHITLDITSYLIPERFKPWLSIITLVFSVIVIGFLFRASILFLQSEIQFGGKSLFGIPYWMWYLIFPISFGMMVLHFLISALLTIAEIKSAQEPPSAERSK